MTKKALIYSFLSFGLIPILPTRILGLPVVFFVLIVFMSIISSRVDSFQWKKALLIISPYMLFCLSVLYSENIGDAARKIIETRLSLFIVPLSFSFLNINQRKLLGEKQWLLKRVFVISTFIFCFIYFITLFFVTETENAAFAFPSGFFFKSALLQIPFIEYEPVNLSFVITIAIIFLSELFYQKKLKLLYVVLFGIFYMVVLLLLVSKLAIIFLIGFLIWLVFKQIKKLKFKILILLGLFFSFFLIGKIPSINYEIREMQYFVKGEKMARDDTGDIRKKITVSSFELARTSNPVFGIGIGDVQKELNVIYEKRGYNELLEKKFDTHNQYLSMYISTGIIGLLSLISIFIVCLVLCIKNKSWYLMWALVFLFFQMITESILERQLTVIIFSLLTSIVLFLPNNINRSNVIEIKN